MSPIGCDSSGQLSGAWLSIRAGVSFVTFRFLRSLPESIGLTDEQPGSMRADKRRTDMARSGSLVMGSGLTGDKNRDFSRQNRTTGFPAARRPGRFPEGPCAKNICEIKLIFVIDLF
ncbi:MAG: hypothetical protein ACLTTP_02630 [Alistipes ihumii]